MKIAVKLCVVAGAAVTLSGCATSPLTSWMFKDRRPAETQGEALAGNATGSLEEGRAHLRDGNISAAVTSFRVAQLDRASRAEASNGLGVAYARLGRDDIAEQYFQAAIAAEPDNTKFVANLLRLQQAGLARHAAARDTQLAATVPTETAPLAAVAQPRAVAESPSLLTGPANRLSRNEVRVSARAEPSRAPAMRVVYRDEPAPAAEQQPAEKVIAAAEPATVVPAAQVRQVDNPFARAGR